jgi:hypothetical protein
VSGVFTISSSGIFDTGEKKCSPITRSLLDQVLGDPPDRQRRGVARQDRGPRDHRLELREHVLLEAQVLRHRLDDQVHRR